MDIVFKLVFWLHLVSLAIGGAASFGVPALLGLALKAEPAQKPVFGQVILRLASVGRMAVVLLILTGAVMVPHFSAAGALNFWFWVKMVLVAGLVGLMIFNIFNGRRMRAGDAAAVARAPVLAKIGMSLLAGIILMAVLAFA